MDVTPTPGDVVTAQAILTHCTDNDWIGLDGVYPELIVPYIAAALAAQRERDAVIAERQSSHTELENDVCCTVADQIATAIRGASE